MAESWSLNEGTGFLRRLARAIFAKICELFGGIFGINSELFLGRPLGQLAERRGQIFAINCELFLRLVGELS
jgi:hypothetical protein